MAGVKIRPFRREDGAAARRIATQSPQAARWPSGDYAGFPAWVAEADAAVAGFVVARVAADEMEILNLAVDPGKRRRGLGGALLDEALDHGRRSGCRRVFLEVRESSPAARGLYERRGFIICGRRPRYYSDPEEDAILMALTFSVSS